MYMEKYLNSNFAEADEQSIKDLQNYLNKLGYKNSSGKKLEVTGVFDVETQGALNQAKEDFGHYKTLGKNGYKVLSHDEIEKQVNSEKKEFYQQGGFDKFYQQFSQEDPIVGTIKFPQSNNEVKQQVYSNVSELIEYYTKLSYEQISGKSDPVYLVHNIDNYVGLYTVNPDFSDATNYYNNRSDLIFLEFGDIEKNIPNVGTLGFYKIDISNNPQYKKIEKFDNFRTPNPPKMKVAEVTNPEPPQTEIPAEVKTTTPQATDVKEPEKPKEKTIKVEIIDNRKIPEPRKISSASKTPEAPKKQGCLSEEEWNGFCEMVEKMGSIDATEQKQINDRISEINRQYETAQIGKINYNEQGNPTMEYYRHTCFQEGKSSIKAPFERN